MKVYDMQLSFPFLLKIFLSILILSICRVNFAKKKSEKEIHEIFIEKADTIILVKAKHTNIYDQILVENVHLIYKDTKLFCDSAIKYGSNDIIEAFDNVQVMQGDSIHLRSQYIRFSNHDQQIQVNDSVILLHNDISLHTNSLNYNLTTKIATFTNRGKIVDQQNIITSNKCVYKTRLNEATFYENVKITNPDYTITADSLKYFTDTKTAFLIAPTNITNDSVHIYTERGFYNTQTNISTLSQNIKIKQNANILTGDSIFYDRNTGIGEIFNKAVLHDTANNFILSGNYMYLSKKGNFAFATDSAVLITINEEDSTFMHADTIKFTKDKYDNNQILSYNKVQFYQKSLQGRCDSMIFTLIDSTLKMFYSPILWVENNQLYADTISIVFQKKEVKQVLMYPKSFIINKEGDKWYNQLKGRRIKGDFHDNKLMYLYVFGNGESIYYPKDENNYIGINHVKSSKVSIAFANEEIEKITFLDSPTGTLYPMKDTSNITLFLPDFKWLEALKPFNKNDIFFWKKTEINKTDLKVKKQLTY